MSDFDKADAGKYHETQQNGTVKNGKRGLGWGCGRRDFFLFAQDFFINGLEVLGEGRIFLLINNGDSFHTFPIGSATQRAGIGL